MFENNQPYEITKYDVFIESLYFFIKVVIIVTVVYVFTSAMLDATVAVVIEKLPAYCATLK